MTPTPNDSRIHELIGPLIDSRMECDGVTRIAHTWLSRAGIENEVWVGRLVASDGKLQSPVHFWLRLADGRLVDYRARMWLGNSPDVPTGIFLESQFPAWQYRGERMAIPMLSNGVIQMMLMDL